MGVLHVNVHPLGLRVKNSTDCFRIMKTRKYTSLSFEQWEFLHVNVHPLGLHVGLSQVFKRMKMREITKK